MFHLPFPKPISSTEHISFSFSVSSSSFKLFAGFCLKYIFWFSGQIFAASLWITAILLKCETYSNNLAFLNIFCPFYTGFPSYCRRLACLEYENNFSKHCKYSVLCLLNTIQMFVTFSPCTLVLFFEFFFPFTIFLDFMYLLVLVFVYQYLGGGNKFKACQFSKILVDCISLGYLITAKEKISFEKFYRERSVVLC